MNLCGQCKKCDAGECRVCAGCRHALAVKRRARARAGLCVYSALCGQPARPGQRCCAVHAAYYAHRANQRKRVSA